MNRLWMNRAACRGVDPDLFFPNGMDAAAMKHEAIQVCRSCPVVMECGEYQKETRSGWGVWAGRVVPDAPGIRVDVHGTEAGAKRHRRRGEEPCRPCRDASNAAKWLRKQRRSA